MLRVLFFILSLSLSLIAGEKVVLLNDTSAHYHWGCTATSLALKEQIEARGFDLYPVPIAANHRLKEIPLLEAFDDPGQFERFCTANKEIFKALQESCGVLINGEDTIYSLHHAPRALLYMAYITKFFLGKPVEIINHSAYPEEERAQSLYQKVYSKLDFIAIREPRSHIEMQKLGITATRSFDCLPLYIRAHYHTPKKIKEKSLLISGSVAFTQNGIDKLSCYMEKMHGRGFTIQLLIGAAANPARDDADFVAALQKTCRAPFTLINATSLEEWLRTIQQASLLVSGRFHHSIAAFCLNTPFIALNSNTPKVEGLCLLIQEPPPLVYDDPKLLEHLLSRTETILRSPASDNAAKREELCDLAERNFDGLELFRKVGYTNPQK